MPLNAPQARVIGSLIEKQLTTPQQYPLTLNALVAACNQTTNRDPIVDFDERMVEGALDELKAAGLVRFVLPTQGRSVLRYRQVLDERRDLDVRQLALVSVLLLRGPQTAGDLRARTERMCQFDDIGSVDSELEWLSSREEPLTRRMSRRSGQKEERWVSAMVEDSGGAEGPESDGHPDRLAAPVVAPASSDLASEVAALRDEVDELRRALEELRVQLGG